MHRIATSIWQRPHVQILNVVLQQADPSVTVVCVPTCGGGARLLAGGGGAQRGLRRRRAIDLLDLEVAGARQVQQLVGRQAPLPHIAAAVIECVTG